MRYAFALLALALGFGSVAAQVTGLAPEGAPPKQPAVPAIALTIRPTPAPVPALKYRLLPELREQKPGNAVFLYYRAFSPEWTGVFQRPEASKQIDAWAEDRRRVPGKELHWVRTFAALKEIDLGARRAYADWEMTDRVRQDGIQLLLPDIQSFRRYAVLLALRARLEMADGRFHQAAETLKTGLTLGRHISEGPTLIQALVGTAVTAIMLEQVEEFIQTPNAPNLYWALTDLPTPFIDLRKAFQGERLFVDNLFPGVRELLADPHAPPLSQAQVDRIIRALPEAAGQDRREPGWQARLGLAYLAAAAYPEAKRFLLAQGWSSREVEAMPLLQAALMVEVHHYDRLYDEMVKWTALPYWQARPGLEQAERELRASKAAGPHTGTTLAALLLPAIMKVQQASARTDRHLAALRCVEALRLHAAAHDGKLPARLADIQAVPIPTDPVTGRAFEYTAEGNKAVLSAGPPAGENAAAHNSLRYELTLKP